MDVTELLRMKKRLGYTNERIAKESGVPFGTVQKVFGGVTRSPRRKTLLKIEKCLVDAGGAAPYYGDDDRRNAGAGSMVAEEAFDYDAGSLKYDDGPAARKIMDSLKKGSVDRVLQDPCTQGYPNQGAYTLRDYYALPDDKRVELIDGVIYDMTAPTTTHQIIIAQIYSQMAPCEEKHKECKIFFSPIDVQLDCDDRTMLEPDIVVSCNLDKVMRRCIFGAPDFVLEVLSPSTKKKDLYTKLSKYYHAGCREYWVIDPDKETVTVHLFENDDELHLYTFDDKVPVGISNGDCEIDFSRIQEDLGRCRNRNKDEP